MAVSAQQIKELRDKTGAGVSDVKRALEESGGDEERAIKLIEQRLGHIAGKKSSRTAGIGIVESYVHSNARVASLVEVYCETDFVAKSPAFREFAHAVALQVAAMRPLFLTIEDVPKELWEVERMRIVEEVAALGKPSAIQEEIVKGKLHAYFGPLSLMEQAFVKDQDKTVREMLNESIGRFGENIKIGRFVRFEV